MRDTVRERSNVKERKTRKSVKERRADGARRRLRRPSVAAAAWCLSGGAATDGGDGGFRQVSGGYLRLRRGSGFRLWFKCIGGLDFRFKILVRFGSREFGSLGSRVSRFKFGSGQI
ncbi:hypothetical protein Hanom_Chr12g01102761 [Helianthus anomalus]